MIHLYFIVLLVLTAIGSSYITMILPSLKSRLLTYFKRKRTDLTPRVDLIEEHLKSHEVQIDNLSKTLARRSRKDLELIRTEVKEYLKQLSK